MDMLLGNIPRDRRHLAKPLESEFNKWLWQKVGMLPEQLQFLLSLAVPGATRLSTYQRLLVLHANSNFKQLKIEMTKIQRIFLDIIDANDPREYYRDDILQRWREFRNISQEEYDKFLEIVVENGNSEFPELSRQTLVNRFYELMIRDEAYLLAMMSKVFPWIAEIDVRIENLIFYLHATVDSEKKAETTREDLQKKYAAINLSLQQYAGLGEPLIEFYLPARSWKNRWRKPF